MTIAPTPTRITDRPPGPHRRYGVEIRPASNRRWYVFCWLCAAIVLIASAWAIWESVR